MPRLTITGPTEASHDVPEGARLTRAITALGIDIGHRCGGNARCTTCRVTFMEGEPETYTAAEYAKLKDRDLLGEARLSCQIRCDHDMTLAVGMTAEAMGWSDSGPELPDEVTPVDEHLMASVLEGEG